MVYLLNHVRLFWNPLTGSSVHRISLARILEGRCHFLLQGIFRTQVYLVGTSYFMTVLYLLISYTFYFFYFLYYSVQDCPKQCELKVRKWQSCLFLT